MKKLFLLVLVVLCLNLTSLALALNSDNATPAQTGIGQEVTPQNPNATRTTYTAPYLQNYNGTWPPADWTIDGNEFNTYWFQYNSSWAICAMEANSFGTSSYLNSPQIYIPGYMYRLDFKWSHTLHSQFPSDKARVEVSSNGSQWETVWEKTETNFNSNDGATATSPGSGVLESLDLSRYSGQTIQVRFYGRSGMGPSWFIDDFNIHYVDTGINTYPSVQDFSSATFPPTNWRNPSLTTYWRRSGANAYGATGQGSAMDWDNWNTGTNTILESPILNLGPYGGTLTFDHAYAHYTPLEPAHKDLQILASNNGGHIYYLEQSFWPLSTYNGDTGGNLITAPAVSTAFTPTGTQWATKTVQLPAGVNLVRFQTINENGSGYLYLDNITFTRRNFPQGTGTAADPFQIFTASELNNVRLYLGSSHADKCFKLMTDIDLLAYLSVGGDGYTAWGTNGWLPIGNGTSAFYGTFDGNNHTISNLRTWYYDTYHGLFGVTATGSTIKNLNLSSTCAILGNGEIGSIAGRNNGIIRNCSSEATINIGNAEKGGGITGNNAGSMFNCRFTGTITRSSGGVTCNKIGGIAGNNETGAVVDSCYSGGSITGNYWNGGLVGWNNGSVNHSHSSGSINGASNSQGGLVGQNNGTISNCYSKATAYGYDAVGGLVGYQGAGSTSFCYATGSVTNAGNAGTKGGIIGTMGAGTVANSYWDRNTTGLTYSSGSTAAFGKTTTEMKTYSTYTGWDFVVETANGSSSYWNMSSTDNNGYPFLAWEYSPDIRPAVPLTPANTTTGWSINGFDITWSQGWALAPHHFNLVLRLGQVLTRFNNITSTSYNPVTQGGYSLQYSLGYNWYVESVAEDGTISTSAEFTFRIEADPAISIYSGAPLVQDFSNETFPPSGWAIQPSVNSWTRNAVNAFGIAGSGSAKADFYSLAQGTIIDLTSPLFVTSTPYIKLTFDYAYASFSIPPYPEDNLEIMYSTDRVNFQSLITYTGGENGNLNTAPPYGGQFVPTPDQWSTKTISLPAHTQQLKFRGTSDFGNNLYVDNIKIEALPFAGNGMADNPFLLYNVYELIDATTYTGSTNADIHFKLMNDIDLTEVLGYGWWDEYGWLPFETFYGHLDGDGKVISGLHATRPGVDNCGFFGIIETGATIENLGIEISPAGTMTGGNRVGALAGWNKGTITGCFSTGAVIGTGNSIGGLVGQNDGTITNSYSRATVSGVNNIGGLVGYENGGSVFYGYATGSITNTGSAATKGGILGTLNAGTVSSSYWDTQTTGVSVSSGSDISFGKSTSEMTTQSTFSGWNFASDWFIHPEVNNGYPQLAWTGAPPALNTPTNIVIHKGTVPGTFTIDWDDMQASWYGIYSGTTSDNLSYRGWTDNHYLTISGINQELFRITSGSGTPPGTQFGSR